MLARAMVGNPDVLIVDEPVTGLDPVHAFTAMARLSAWAASGHAVVASLHDLTLAGRYASGVLALKDGRVAGEGVLDGALIRNVFGVAAEIRGTGSHFAVDFLTPKAELNQDAF
jgi:iron complex transport system ATP-binding protein